MGSRAAGSLGVNAASTGLGIHGNSVNSPRPTQVYEHTFESGKTYTGVGDLNGKRASQSARDISRRTGDKLVRTTSRIEPNRAQAYLREQARIDIRGGVIKNPHSYNRRNSPGLKLLKKLF